MMRIDIDVIEGALFFVPRERKRIWLGDWSAFWAGVDAETAHNEFLNSVTEAYEQI